MKLHTLPALALAAIIAIAGQAQAELSQETEITEGLIRIGIAYEIDQVCDELDGRRIRGLNALLALRARAVDLGYSSAEIEAYIDNKAEKDRLEAIGRARLAQMGAVRGDAASHCAVGRAEIAKGSIIGSFLRD